MVFFSSIIEQIKGDYLIDCHRMTRFKKMAQGQTEYNTPTTDNAVKLFM